MNMQSAQRKCALMFYAVFVFHWGFVCPEPQSTPEIDVPTMASPLAGKLKKQTGGIFPETREFLRKLEKVKTVQEMESMQDEETFELVDFGKTNGPSDKQAPTAASKKASCQPGVKKEFIGSTNPSENVRLTVSESGVSEPGTAQRGGDDAGSLAEDDSATATETSFADTVEQDVNNADHSRTSKTVPEQDEKESSPVPDVVDETPDDQADVTEPQPSKFAEAVERRMQNPSLEPSEITSGGKTPKGKRKKKKPEELPTPTKEQLEETYKYEVLPPPDNSAVQLDFPASPMAQGEEHLSQHVPLNLYCDACMAIAYQLHKAFDKFYSLVKKRPPTESEIYDLVDKSCQRSQFLEYGMLEVHGHRHITGPGCNELEAEGGVKHSRGPWPKRLGDRCQEVTEDVGELAIHAAWLRGGRDPEQLKLFMCMGAAPRDYCQRYGHMDAAAEAAARRHRQGTAKPQEDAVAAASRLAREAEEEEMRRLAAEQEASVPEEAASTEEEPSVSGEAAPADLEPNVSEEAISVEQEPSSSDARKDEL